METKVKGVTENGSRWFRRFTIEASKLSPHIKFKRIKFGFYRIYWVDGGEPAYIGECYKEMGEVGYEVEEKNYQLESKKYYEEYEDNPELIRKIKNFVEGYRDSIHRLKTKVWMMKNNDEFRKTAVNGYKQMKVK